MAAKVHSVSFTQPDVQIFSGFQTLRFELVNPAPGSLCISLCVSSKVQP